MTDELGFAVSADLLRRGHNVTSLVHELAARLERAIPEHVDVVRRRLRRTTTLTVSLGLREFRIELHGHRVHAWIDHIVRDVCVRSEEMHLDPWLDGLAAALDQEAHRSTRTRLALEEALS